VGDAQGSARVIRFAAPWMLAIGVPLALLVLWRVTKLPREHAGLRRRLIQALMSLAIVAAALAIARPELGRAIDRLAVVFLVDDSRSVARGSSSTEAARAVRASIGEMNEDDAAGLVVFGADTATLIAPSPQPSVGVVRASIARDGTDVAAAIRRGLADLPSEHSPRLVLLSDGAQTRGDALAAAQVAAGRGVPIDVWVIERAPSAELAVERVRMPPVADPGQPVELRVVTRATQEARVRVRVRRDGESIAEAETTIRAGNDVLTLREIAPDPGVHRYEVLLEPLDEGSDVAVENNEGGALIRVTGGSRALVLASRPEEANALVEALRAAGIDTHVGGPAQVPADLAELAGWDLIVMSDLHSRALTDGQMNEIASYVRDLGGGLLMVGARESFGLGGYAYTPIEEVLPATFDLRRRRDRASLAMVIAIDKSGSMTIEAVPGTTKLALANEAAARSALLLSPMDSIAVCHVDTEVTWTQRMTMVEDPARIAAVVRRAQPGGGGILVDLTLEASYDALRDQPAQLRHLLLFSDGSDSEEMTNARQLVGAAARDGITTTIVSMGTGPDTPELEVLSRLGGGRFYIVDDMTQLPRIFTEETIAASRAALVNEAFRVVPGAPSAITRGIDWGSAPALGGHAVINARPRASVLLAANEEDPLLLVHQHGVGRSAVFATDAGAAFGRSWLTWPGYSALFGQLGRSIARSPERRDAQVGVTLSGGTGRIVVEAIDDAGQTRNYLDLSATVAGPHGRSERVELRQSGAGRYEGTFDAEAPGPYLVTVREGAEGMVGSAGVVRPRGDELRGEGTDRALLEQIAALTGGRVRTDLREVFTDRPDAAYTYAPIWQPLVLFAILALLASVTLRRLVIPGLERKPAAAPSRVPRTSIAPSAPNVSNAPSKYADVVPDAAPPEHAPAPEAPTPAAAPATLAETLLARKKKKR
jgi:Ca-activated chloride channel family protein